MIASEDIIHIRRGLFCLAPKYRRQELNLYSIAERIYGPSYVSLESALSYHGWIPEAVYTVTCASMAKAKDFKTPLGLFSFKRVPSVVFYEQVERIAVDKNQVFLMARPFKALVDYVYVYKKDWTSFSTAAKSLRIEPEHFESVSKEELLALRELYSSRRISKFIAGVQKELGLK